MIDLHTHLLPGVDDGSPSLDASLPVLERFAEHGVEVLACTPHLKASNVQHAPYDEHARIFESLVDAAPESIKLILGWEIMLDEPNVDLTETRLALGGSTAVLVEFSSRHLPPASTQELARIRDSGRVPIVAHPERYRGCTPELVAEWRSAGAAIQMDVPSLHHSPRLKQFSEQLLEQGLVDLFASDTHVDSRSLDSAREWLRERAPEPVVDLLVHENARRLLAGEELVPVPPIRFRRGVIDRLRSFVSRTK